MKYSEIIGVGKHFKSAFDVTSDRGETWKTFISNERFERNLSQIMTSLTSPSLNKRKSIWTEGPNPLPGVPTILYSLSR